MTLRTIWGAVAACLALLAAGPGVAGETSAPAPLPLDVATGVNGVEVVCTGIGRAIRDDPRWAAYSVRVEFSNAANEYLPASRVALRDRSGRALLDVSCQAPWLLMRLAPGAYRVEGRLEGAGTRPRSAPITAPAKGQVRVVLQFPDA